MPRKAKRKQTSREAVCIARYGKASAILLAPTDLFAEQGFTPDKAVSLAINDSEQDGRIRVAVIDGGVMNWGYASGGSKKRLKLFCSQLNDLIAPETPSTEIYVEDVTEIDGRNAIVMVIPSELTNAANS